MDSGPIYDVVISRDNLFKTMANMLDTTKTYYMKDDFIKKQDKDYTVMLKGGLKMQTGHGANFESKLQELFMEVYGSKLIRYKPGKKEEKVLESKHKKLKGELKDLQPIWFESFFRTLRRHAKEYGFVGIESLDKCCVGVIVESFRRQKNKIVSKNATERSFDRKYKLTDSMIERLNDIDFPWEKIIVEVDV